MLNPPLMYIDTVYHVGTMDPDDTRIKQRSSLEAHCLSVSLDPEEWRGIARAGDAPTWSLRRSGACWLDVCALLDDQTEEIITWAQDQGYIEPATWWRAWWFDGESDDWVFMRCDSLEKALQEVEDDDQVDDGCPSGSGSPIEQEDGFCLTEKGMLSLQRWGEKSQAIEGAVILYAQDILSEAVPGFSGLWWNEIDNPEALSCPRGGILSAKLNLFKTVNLEKPSVEMSPSI